MIAGTAALICVLAAYAALRIFARARVAQRTLPRLAYLSVAAVALGCGLCAAHLLALDVFVSNLPENVEPVLSADAVIVAIVFTWLGLGLALLRPASAFNGGAIIIGGAGVMHYIGMSALPLAGAMAWNAVFVGASACIGLLLGATALQSAMRTPDSRHRRGAALLALAIVAVQFSAASSASRVSLPLPRGNVDYAAHSAAPGTVV